MAKKRTSQQVRPTKMPTKQNAIIQNITIQPFNRQSVDIGNWRNATRSAESNIPRRVYLYDLYHDIYTTDGQIIAVWSKRQDAITTANWEFTDKDGNPVDEINELIDCIGFEDLLKEIIDSKAWGYSMCEPTFFINENGQNEFELYSVPKKHMRPEKGQIVKQQNDDEGININEGIYAKTVMQFGKPTDLGLLLSAAMYSIYKRGSTADWAEFIEIFGRGIIDAEWDGFDEGQRQQLAKAIRDMGSGGILIRPSGTSVDIKNNTGNANGQLQDTFVSKMDAYISKVLLGTTETTDSSQRSGYAQAEVHAKEDEKKNESDLNFVRRSLNSQFIKVLKAAGFDTKGGTFVIKKDKNLDKSAFDIHMDMRRNGIPVDDDFFYEEYGVRKPDNYDELKNKANSAKNDDLSDDTPTNKEDKDARTPSSSSNKKDSTPTKLAAKKDDTIPSGDEKISWFRRLLRLFSLASAVTNQPLAGAYGDHHTNNVELAKFAASKVFDNIKDDLIEYAWKQKGKLEFDRTLFEYTAKALTKAFIEGWNTKPTKLMDLGFTYGVDDPVTMTAYEMNLFRFAGAKTLYEAQQLNELFRKSTSFREFYDTASSMLTVHNRSWLETEYITAKTVGSMASTYNRLMKETETFPYWMYKTAEDSKVRHTHAMLHDIVLPYNDPLWKYIMPPNGWNCRCWIVPRTKEEVTKEEVKTSREKAKAYLQTETFKREAKAGFGVNRLDKGQVFTENQHYANDYLNVVNRMNKLDFKAYGLKPLAQNYNNLEFEPKYGSDQREAAINDFTERLEKVTARKYGIKDFNNRTIVVDKSTIRKHTTDRIPKYQDRHTYLNEVNTIINQPDEVWLRNYGDKKYEAYIYVKYYRDRAIVVVCKLSDNLELQIETWFRLDDPNLRGGLLIKQ